MTNADRARWARQAANVRLPLWVRLAMLAEAAARNGHAPLPMGRLRRIDPNARPDVISRAIGVAIRNGLLDPRSSSRCLVLPGAGAGGCPQLHRDGS